MAGHIRKKTLKNGYVWQVVVETGSGEKRSRIYRNVRGTKKEAEMLKAKLLSELQSGDFVQPSRVTLGSYLREWYDNHVVPNLSPASADGYRINIEKHIIPALGGVLLQELRPIHLQRFYRGKMTDKGDEKGLSAKSVLYIHRNIHAALEQAVRMQMIPRNPASLVPLPKAERYEARVYSEKQLRELVAAAKGTDMELPIALAATLGLRRGELLGLRWSSVDFGGKRIYIQDNLVSTSKGTISKSPKSKTSIRAVDIPDGLLPLLKKHRKGQARNRLLMGKEYCPGDFVCCQTNGMHYNPGYFSKKFKDFLEKMGLPHIRLHDLRHSFATLLLQYGIEAKVASEMLGHSSVGITLDLYTHVPAGMKSSAAQKVGKGILGGGTL